jgi:hypothetical protein
MSGEAKKNMVRPPKQSGHLPGVHTPQRKLKYLLFRRLNPDSFRWRIVAGGELARVTKGARAGSFHPDWLTLGPVQGHGDLLSVAYVVLPPPWPMLPYPPHSHSRSPASYPRFRATDWRSFADARDRATSKKRPVTAGIHTTVTEVY